MAKLTPEQRKQAIADYIQCQNYSEVGRKYGVSRTAIKNIVDAEPGTCERLQEKQEEITQSTLEYMQQQTNTKIKLLDKLLDAMLQKAENVDMFTNIKDLATAYGIITDKEIKLLEIKVASGDKGGRVQNDLLNAIEGNLPDLFEEEAPREGENDV